MEFLPLIASTVGTMMNTIFKNIRNRVDLGKNMESMNRALDELIEARIDAETQVEDTVWSGRKPKNHAKEWLKQAVSIEAEAKLIMNDVESVNHNRSCCCYNCHCGLRYKLTKKLRQKLKIINELNEKKNRGEKTGGMGDIEPVIVLPSGSAVGFDAMLERVRRLIEGEGAMILGIYGMGGVGKTTLLKMINNELAQTLGFDVVIWAVASKDFVAEKIQQAIVARLGLSWDEQEAGEQRTTKIFNVMRKKRFLLLLDDVWAGIDLLKLGVPLPNKDNKSSVVFTTRSMDVCSDMDASKIKIEFLNERDAWLLFWQKVGRADILSSQSIRSYAKAIVRKCGGLPLALVTMGRVMANKETENEWEYAIQMLDESPTELRGMDDVFRLLEFSYRNLGSDTMRLCLMYCCLFPEDYSIEIEQLIELWIGEGFLDDSREGKAQHMGHAIVGSLKVACLLEAGELETQVKMHDVVRSFVLWMASECGKNKTNYMVQPSAGLTKPPGSENWELAQRVSLWDNAITELPEVLACPRLLTLLLQWNSGLSRISNGFFDFMPSLRVLDLSFTSLKELPTSIGHLVELRHLDLSRTKLSTLPKQLGNLQKLKHLDLQRTYLRTIPREAINGLSQVRVLNLYYSYGSWETQDSECGNEVTLADLERLRHLTTLGITITESHTLERLAVSKTMLRIIQYLYITECEGLYILPLSTTLDDGQKLRRLSVNNCRDLMWMEVGAENQKNWLRSLEVLALYRLPSLTIVWKNPITKGSLENLRSINIWYCDKLKDISWIVQLPKLETIYLFYCKQIEEVISADQRASVLLPRLRTISMRDLPALTSIVGQAMDLPCLQSIAVINCPKLTKLPLEAFGKSTLPMVYGEKEWWDKLEWDAVDTKATFVSHFMAT